MRTHLLGLPACRRPVIVEQGPQFNSTQIINFGNIVPDCGYSYDNCFRTGFWNTAGSIVGGMLAGLLFGGCLKGGRGGEKVEKSSTETDTTTKTKEDKDIPKISELIDKLSAVKATPDEKSAKELYNTLKTLSEKPIDDVNKDHNIKYYKHLLEDLESFAKEKGWKLGDASDTNEVKPNDGKDNGVKDEHAETLKSTTWNTAVLPSENDLKNADASIAKEGYTYATKDDDFSKATIKRAHDTGVPRDVSTKSGNVSYVSPDKDASGFPKYLVIEDEKGNFKYTFAGVVGGKAIYNTPQKDINNNHYVLVKDTQGNLVLWQDKGINGHNIKDTQLDK